ncbi:CHAT domain-containing protein [Ruminococcaceae bacterium OttesenSCG-928-D13]|nr:CHAT domain-containing protein [Ruminococcaceae bacterium OttesenSCG-928-D13]
MSLVDTYRNNAQRKQADITKLSQDKAKESSKIATLRGKINSANSAIARTKTPSTIRSKQNEIARAEKDIAACDKKIADIERKIAQKRKEVAAEEKKVRNEEDKEQKKRDAAEKRRIQESDRQLNQINTSISRHERTQTSIINEIEKLKYVPEIITVLFMASNPVGSDHLRLDEEARNIQEMIRKSKHRDSVKFDSRWAVRPLDILQAINEVNPDIVHFSGHGAETGDLVLENQDGNAKFVTKEAITQTIMAASDKIKMIFFNTCFSYEQAQAVVTHVDAAIGMLDSVGDKAAQVFAAQFYSAIGFGLPLQKAFDQAKSALLLEGIPEDNTPYLYVKDGLDASEVYLVRPEL